MSTTNITNKDDAEHERVLAKRARVHALHERILAKRAKVTIIGAGYVGLPLAVRCANVGHFVTIYDIDQRKIDSIAAGKSYIGDVPDDQLKSNGYPIMCATADPAIAMRDPDIVVICVPTPLNKTKDPDVSMVVSAARTICDHTPFPPPERLVVLESTVYPGFTREVLLPELVVGCDWNQKRLAMESLFVAFSPERVDPSNTTFGVQNTPKVVGGLSRKSTELAVAFYDALVSKVVPVSSCDAAEMSKVIENTFRMVNIALANETALECGKLGLDVWEVIGAAATKPFGFMPFWPGPGVGGHCLAASEWVYYRHNGAIGIDRMDQLWTRFGGRADQNLIVPDGLQVLGIDGAGFVQWCDVTAFARRGFSGDMVNIKTHYGYTLDVTEDHPMLVLSENSLHIVSAGEVKVADTIPCFLGNAPECKIRPVVDVIAHLPFERKKGVRVRLRGSTWRSHKDLFYEMCNSSAKYDFVRQDCVPLSLFLEFEKRSGLDLRRDAILLTGRGSSFSMLPAMLECDDDFVRLVGYYLSEGCIGNEHPPRIRLTFGKHEKEYIQDTHAILAKFGIRWSDSIQENSHHIRVASGLMGFVLRDILLCGCNSYEKQIPSLFFDMPTAQRRQLLGALIRGDGSCGGHIGTQRSFKNGREYHCQNNSAHVSFFSASEKLSRGVAYLLQSLGMVPRIGVKKHQRGIEVDIGGGSSIVGSCADLFGRNKGNRILAILANRRRDRGARFLCRQNQFTGVAVTAVGKRYVENHEVFSLEVAKTHTFAAGFGCFVHNCIGLDPHYLAWKLRGLNYRSRFIELAEQINSVMPEHVVRLAIDALSRHSQKAIAGARVLILGMAYKRDVADVRESPALEVVRLLNQHGAKVRFYDPLVPTVRLENGDNWQSVDNPVTAAQEADCVLIVTDHRSVDYRAVCAAAPLVVDARNATKDVRAEFSNKIVVL